MVESIKIRGAIWYLIVPHVGAFYQDTNSPPEEQLISKYP